MRKIFASSLIFLFAMLFNCLSLGAIEISIDYFYDQLAPYGEWIQANPYGWVWIPDNIEPEWRPYTEGEWVYSDYGWTFVSDDDYGWAVYHYGRWVDTDDYGWVWVPGTDWGPAWVAWRYDNDYIGWAPLPPKIGWSVSVGIDAASFNIDTDINWSSWCFVEPNWFLEPRIRSHIFGVEHNVVIINQTRNITNYKYVNKRIVNNSFNISDFEKRTKKKVVTYKLEESQSPSRSRNTIEKSRPISLFKPVVSSKKPEKNPKTISTVQKKQSKNEILKQQETEKKRLSDYYDQKANELKKSQKVEADKNARSASQAELKKKHDAEAQALKDQKNKESKVLNNKQKRKLNESSR